MAREVQATNALVGPTRLRRNHPQTASVCAATMTKNFARVVLSATGLCVVLLAGSDADAQPATNAPGARIVAPTWTSPQVSSERRVTFRVLATNANSVRLSGGDIPGLGGTSERAAFKKGTNGVWELTVGPLEPGAYRYHFNVDGVSVVDPRNPATSESNANTWSLVQVPGSEFMDVKDVPHGALTEVTYYSPPLKRFRRMHVYTPPGYESGKGKYPVFYLLHGASDSDDSWSSVGRAHVILDNLIATKQAKPMIVVMPAGHTGPFSFGSRGSDPLRRAVDEFVQDFEGAIVPHVERHYRVKNGRGNRAIAGLSMGGAQTLNIAMRNLDQFGYVGVYSSGLFGINNPTNSTAATWEQQHASALANKKLKKDLKLMWFATGKDDFLVETSRQTVSLLKKHGFDVVYRETDGAHTWLVWRAYLREFAPQLF
jgi:enterochelin esterase-like enzyme